MLSERRHGRHIVRLALVFSTLLASSSFISTTVTAEHTAEAAERAAREILDARDRANAAAQAMFDAESRLDGLTIELGRAEQHLAELEAEVSTLRSGLAESAIRQFVGSGHDTLMLFDDLTHSNDHASASVFAGAATGAELVRADDYDAAIDETEKARAAFAARRAETERARDDFDDLRSRAEAEVLDLQAFEQVRLADAEVEHELERQRLEREAQARAESERVAAAAAADEAARAAAAKPAAIKNSGGSPAPSRPTAPAAPPAPAPTPGMACPVAGARSFADTWGAPRSGGRSHEGVDMMAAGGTPLVAVESGSAHFKTNRLGGNAVWLNGASGTKYYYAHLSSWEGSSRTVSKGEVIGYVGKTGNTSVDHLHFEVHPGGGAAVNPYPYVRSAC